MPACCEWPCPLCVSAEEPVWQQCLRSVQSFSQQTSMAGAVYSFSQSLNSKETSRVNRGDLLWKYGINQGRPCLWGSREGRHPQVVWEQGRNNPALRKVRSLAHCKHVVVMGVGVRNSSSIIFASEEKNTLEGLAECYKARPKRTESKFISYHSFWFSNP